MLHRWLAGRAISHPIKGHWNGWDVAAFTDNIAGIAPFAEPETKVYGFLEYGCGALGATREVRNRKFCLASIAAQPLPSC